MNAAVLDARPTRFRWVIFGLACGTSWLLYLHRYVFALLKPKLVEEWGLGKDELGLLDSAFSVCYTACQIPLGVAADALGVHLVLTAMMVVWSVGLGLHAWAPADREMWAARVVLGAGQSGVFATINRITKTWFPLSIRTTVQGWAGVFSGRIGGFSANLLVGGLLLGVLHAPWRPTVYALAGFGLIFALAFALLFRNSPAQHPAVNPAELSLIEETPPEPARPRPAALPRMTVREMFRRMSTRSIANLLMLNLQTILSTLADNVYSNWIPLFLYEVHRLEFSRMGVYATLPLLGGALGGVCGGWLNDRLIRALGNRRWPRTIVALTGKGTAAMVLMAAFLVYDDPQTFCVVLFVVKFFADWGLASSWGTVSDIGGRTTASVFAFNNSVAGIGSIFGPVLYGFVAHHAGWVPVFLTAAGAYIACALCWLAIDCRIPVVSEEAEKDDAQQ